MQSGNCDEMFVNVEHVDIKAKYLIDGFFRINIDAMELHCYANVIYSTIPRLVINMCLAFYYDPKFFEDGPHFLKVNSRTYPSQETVVCKEDQDRDLANAIYAKEWIDSCSKTKHIWKIKPIYSRSCGGIGVGLVSNKHHNCIDQDWDDDHSYYTSNGGYVAQDGDRLHDDGPEYGTDDIFTFILDLKQRKIYGYVDNKQNLEIVEEKSALFEEIKIGPNVKYRFVLSLYYKDDSVTVFEMNRRND